MPPKGGIHTRIGVPLSFPITGGTGISTYTLETFSLPAARHAPTWFRRGSSKSFFHFITRV